MWSLLCIDQSNFKKLGLVKGNCQELTPRSVETDMTRTYSEQFKNINYRLFKDKLKFEYKC